MPGVDLLDAFAELVVCFVFSLPRDKPQPSSSDDDLDNPAGLNSSNTTQIFSRVNSIGENQAQALLQLSPNTCDAAVLTATNASSFACAAPLLSERSSTQSLDLYTGGFWNPMARVPPHQSNIHAAAITTAAANSSSSCPSSAASLNIGDISMLGNSGPGTDRNTGFWNRLLGSSGVLHTPPSTSSCGQCPNTGVTTSASSYVQLTEEELGMMNRSGRVGGASGWTSFTSPLSCAQYSSPQQLDLNGGDSRGVPTPTSLSITLNEASSCASATPPPPMPLHPSSSLQQQSLTLNPHGLFIDAPCSSPPQDGQSQESSVGEFVVL